MKLVIGDPANIDNVMVEMGNHRFPNMGILAICGFLRDNMDSIELDYLRGDLNLDVYTQKLSTFKPDMYGISFASWVADISYKTIDAVKGKFPDMPVICGGTHPTTNPEEVLNRSLADICVIGEGEYTMLELAEYFRTGKGSLSEIKGIAYKEKGGIKKALPREHVKDLGTLPLPAWDMINIEDYEGLGYCKAKPNTAMVFSRGCPYNCVYCSNPVWRSAKPWMRLRPPEQIAEEITLLYNKGVREIWIRADEFNSDLKWTLEVCKAIKALNCRDLYFECNLRADRITEELVQAFSEINIWMINLGVETLNQRVLDGIKKQVTVQQIIDGCRLLKKYDIDIYAWLMYYQIWEEDGKLCWETPQEVDNTIRAVRKMHKEGLIDLVSWQVATPIPGADMFHIAEKHGLIKEPQQFNVWKISMSIPGITERQVQIHRLKGMLLQSYMAYKKGRVGWHTRHNIVNRLKYIINAAIHSIKPQVLKKDV